ncbi:MAG: glycosyltransferase family 9 protein [Bacteroidota bacterium]
MTEKAPIKVLVIRFSSIGDIVLCSPVLRCIKKVEGQNIITHLLTKKTFASFTSNYPYVDRVITLDQSLEEVIQVLKAENYDFVLDLHNNIRSWRVKLALGKPSKAFNKINIEKWLLTQFKIDRLPRVHIVDRLMEAAKPLGVVNDGLGLDFVIPEKDKVNKDDLPAAFRKGYVGFVIGGTYFTKRLPPEKIVQICQGLHKPVILLGGPEDRKTGEHIAKQLEGSVLNTCGDYSLNASASLVEQAEVIISHDTGLMHIAAALNKPLASVWGNTVPELGMYPYFPHKATAPPHLIFEVKGLPCRPCSKLGYDSCPKKHFKCMKDIDVESLCTWVNAVAG